MTDKKEKPPIVNIFTMEKVGSSTVMAAIKSSGLDAHRSYRGNIVTISDYDKMPVVTMVRDPIARNISQTFESLQTVDHQEPFQFFDIALPYHYGVDVYAENFVKSKGYRIYQGKKAGVLVIKTEALTEKLDVALAELLDRSPSDFTVEHRAIGAEKFGDTYDEFLKKQKFDLGYLEAMYSTPYMMHFYTQKEIRTLTNKWKK